MATSNTQCFSIVLLLSVLLISTAPSSSAARLLNGDFSLTAVNLALPSDNVRSQAAHVETAGKLTRFHATAPRLAGKYGPLVLNMLPKGMKPPSGPSKRANNINN